MNNTEPVYVAGHRGMVGSAIVRLLEQSGTGPLLLATRQELDLTDQAAVDAYFAANKPGTVYLAAARVGGILANDTYPADFIRDNLLIQTNIIDAALRHGTRKLLFLGSSCIYPKHAPIPIHEDALLTAPLEPTNEWYAVAKIAGIKMIQAYRRQHGFNGISVMPTNLYGPNDNFDLETSHVLPALLRKFHEAKMNDDDHVVVWGSGKPRREFMHVDDVAAACVHLMDTYDGDGIVNIGTGKDIEIGELAALIAEIVGFDGELVYDTTKPDGTPEKRLDVSRLHDLGFSASIELRRGIESTYRWYLDALADGQIN